MGMFGVSRGPGRLGSSNSDRSVFANDSEANADFVVDNEIITCVPLFLPDLPAPIAMLLGHVRQSRAPALCASRRLPAASRPVGL